MIHVENKTLLLAAPNWDNYQTFENAHLPFPLWPIGDQPLLYHWFDYAISHGYSQVNLYVPSQLPLYKKYIHQATLWPLDIHLHSVEKLKDSDHALTMDRLPSADPKASLPSNPWSLLLFWQSLEHQWFQFSYLHKDILDFNLAIGRYCIIHPSAKIIMPVWIGNSVTIGPDCEIGPYAAIGSGSIIEGHSVITHSRVAPNTFLGAHTELDQCYLNGHTLYNLKHEAYIPYLDPFIADFVNQPTNKPSLFQRAYALILWLFFKMMHTLSGSENKPDSYSKTIHHHKLPKVSPKAPLWQQRYPWLLSVVKGKMHLFGVLPRTPTEFQRLSPDVQKILSEEPEGVFSYADAMNCHDPQDPKEQEFAVHQATHPKEKMLPFCRQFLRKMIINTFSKYGH